MEKAQELLTCVGHNWHFPPSNVESRMQQLSGLLSPPRKASWIYPPCLCSVAVPRQLGKPEANSPFLGFSLGGFGAAVPYMLSPLPPSLLASFPLLHPLDAAWLLALVPILPPSPKTNLSNSEVGGG